jgi:hypothetical protein
MLINITPFHYQGVPPSDKDGGVIIIKIFFLETNLMKYFMVVIAGLFRFPW